MGVKPESLMASIFRCLCVTFCCSSVIKAADWGEELGQREAGAAGEVESGESSVGAEAERGHITTGHGRSVCACVIRRLEMKSDVLKSASYLNLMHLLFRCVFLPQLDSCNFSDFFRI